jgi:hypothetical protein
MVRRAVALPLAVRAWTVTESFPAFATAISLFLVST